MLYIRFSLLLSLVLFSFSAAAAFNLQDCLNSEFSAKVSHKGSPMGLAKNILMVEKRNCVVTVSHEKYRFMKRKWIIDVCRAPVHIKYGTGAIEVFKRSGYCSDDKKEEDYCVNVETIDNIIQDDGLIFAEGEKENLTSDHGKVYCAHLLIRSYLVDGNVFSRSKDMENQFGIKSQSKNIISPDEKAQAQPAAPVQNTKVEATESTTPQVIP